MCAIDPGDEHFWSKPVSSRHASPVNDNGLSHGLLEDLTSKDSRGTCLNMMPMCLMPMGAHTHYQPRRELSLETGYKIILSENRNAIWQPFGTQIDTIQASSNDQASTRSYHRCILLDSKDIKQILDPFRLAFVSLQMNNRIVPEIKGQYQEFVRVGWILDPVKAQLASAHSESPTVYERYNWEQFWYPSVGVVNDTETPFIVFDGAHLMKDKAKFRLPERGGAMRNETRDHREFYKTTRQRLTEADEDGSFLGGLFNLGFDTAHDDRTDWAQHGSAPIISPSEQKFDESSRAQSDNTLDELGADTYSRYYFKGPRYNLETIHGLVQQWFMRHGADENGPEMAITVTRNYPPYSDIDGMINAGWRENEAGINVNKGGFTSLRESDAVTTLQSFTTLNYAGLSVSPECSEKSNCAACTASGVCSWCDLSLAEADNAAGAPSLDSKQSALTDLFLWGGFYHSAKGRHLDRRVCGIPPLVCVMLGGEVVNENCPITWKPEWDAYHD